ncbi:hypothetical protein HPP92_007900 [Vanilla planifolia]|uniref:Uncharacterized protein n=1 Tax=Vanilla planifolia TaxID=51239 RepID=A0A835RS37_VANPL|nr:hypothetical protein HPP92_007900 [Vanilla planifolia]
MNVEQVFHMMEGGGKNSYATNSRLQEHAIIRTRPIQEEAIGELCNTISAETLVIADLGCASGPNAFRVISEIIASVEGHYIRSGRCPPEIQYFLNDLPGNDFNSLFRSPYLYERRTSDQEVVGCLPLYVVGLPGSFYGRLFPLKSVHLFTLLIASIGYHRLVDVHQVQKQAFNFIKKKEGIFDDCRFLKGSTILKATCMLQKKALHFRGKYI